MTRERFREKLRQRGLPEALADTVALDADQYAAHTAELAARPPDHWGPR